MDLLTRWIDRSATVRVALLEATYLARSLCVLHDLQGSRAAGFCQSLSGALLLATDLKPGLTLSLHAEVGTDVFHADATPQGLVRGMWAPRRHESTGAQVTVRRMGQSGMLYQSVVNSLGSEPAAAFQDFVMHSEQQASALEMRIDLDEAGLPSKVSAAWARGFPDTSPDQLEAHLQSWRKRTAFDPEHPALADREVAWDLLGREEIVHHCPCARERALSALVALGKESAMESMEKGDPFEVTCEFCKSVYDFDPSEVMERFD